MFEMRINYRDEKILNWLRRNGTKRLRHQEIALRYNISERTVARILKSFKDAGLIEIESRNRGGIIVRIQPHE